MRSPLHRGRTESYIQVRLIAVFALLVAGLTSLPMILRAIDLNGDNLDDAWEAGYGITTGAYASTHLVGWWQMDGPTNVADRSPNQINGSLSGFASNPFSAGLFSNAINFTPEARVDFPAASALDTTNGLTFSTWIKASSGATNATTIATWTDTQTNSWSVGIATNGMAQISFRVADGSLQTIGPSTNSVTLYDGAWHHLAATWAVGDAARVYVDGENEGSAAPADWSAGKTASFTLGAPDESVTNAAFALDETRLYNRALGPNEVTQLPVTYTDLNGNGLTVWEDYQRSLSPTVTYSEKPLKPAAPLPVAVDEPGSSAFTPWMKIPEMKIFMKQFDSTPPGGHPNYWDKGHWISAVEGRWHDDQIEYRITYGPVPKHKGLWWYWYLGIDRDYYNSIARKNAADGFTLLDANSFSNPAGRRYYQGVWHKVTQWTTNAPAPAAAPASK